MEEIMKETQKDLNEDNRGIPRDHIVIRCIRKKYKCMLLFLTLSILLTQFLIDALKFWTSHANGITNVTLPFSEITHENEWKLM